MPKYYFCEADNADEGITKVTPCETAEEALDLAQNSEADVHFVSTVNPLEDEEDKDDE